MLTKNDCVNSHYRQTFYHCTIKNSRGLPVVCRVNGKCKTWKKQTDKFKLPVKYGLRDCFYITNDNAYEWCLTEEEASLHPLKKGDDFNKFLKITDNKLKPSSFICSKCKKTYPININLTTGYGINPDTQECVCYTCCGQVDRENMIKNGRIILYLSDKKYHPDYYEITNWPGSLKFKTAIFSEGKHNWAGKSYHVWFKGPDDYIWHGVQYGDNTQLCHCKRTKRKVTV